MSAANNSAKKRRASNFENPVRSGGIPSATSVNYNSNNSVQKPTNNLPQNGNITTALTLPQVISVIDKRLLNLEKIVIELNNKPSENEVNNKHSVNNVQNDIQNEYLDEFNNRFEILAEEITEFNNRFEILTEEISELKNTIIKLQSYTMDVNKMLLSEREQYYSTIIQTPSDEFTLYNNEMANDQPVNDQPANDQPANDQPANDQPANDQPANVQPANDQPVNDQPANSFINS